jgi:hypothetical protein
MRQGVAGAGGLGRILSDGQWIFDSDPSDDLAVIQVLGPDFMAVGAFGCHDYQGIPERQAVNNAAIDGLLNKTRRNDYDFEALEGMMDILDQEFSGLQFIGGGHVKFLHDLG